MEMVREDTAMPRKHPIESARKPDAEPLHAARQRNGVFGLDDHVKVIAEDAVFHKPDAETATRAREAFFDLREPACAAQRRDRVGNPQRDVDWSGRMKPRARKVTHQRVRSFRFAARAASFAAANRVAET